MKAVSGPKNDILRHIFNCVIYREICGLMMVYCEKCCSPHHCSLFKSTESSCSGTRLTRYLLLLWKRTQFFFFSRLIMSPTSQRADWLIWRANSRTRARPHTVMTYAAARASAQVEGRVQCGSHRSTSQATLVSALGLPWIKPTLWVWLLFFYQITSRRNKLANIWLTQQDDSDFKSHKKNWAGWEF